MSKHTPGPWAVSPPSRHDRVFPFAVEGDGGEVARCVSHADARLMAAAPELLEVLKYFMPFIESEQDDERQGPWVEKARALLTKIEAQP